MEIAHAESKTIKIILAFHISATDCKPYNKLMKQESSSIVHPNKRNGEENQVTKTEPEFIIFHFIGERVKGNKEKKNVKENDKEETHGKKIIRKILMR